ncbi:hypothetical protein COV94_03200 [Candidatus Woesearchaeota archaeon CG11_big_fil_rev_8_21_14_0_20_57_5]|nr:MAG: hypothetical protein COV94_03200 [Candidatus Woesearchaeota archaeon CG11_big_fil_rev_8_21_14_0_20_57_5]
MIVTVSFAVMEKGNILSDRKKHAVVAILLALIVVMPHAAGLYLGTWDPVNFLNLLLPFVALLLVGLFCLLLLIGPWGPKVDYKLLLAIIIGIELVIPDSLIWGSILAKYAPESARVIWAQVKGFLIALLVFLLLIWYITRDPPARGDSAGKEKNN